MIKLIKNTFYHEDALKRQLCHFIKTAKVLSFNTECESFEKNFAKWQGRKYCVMVNSGSSANLTIIQTLLNLGKIKKGDKVGFSALTWSTNVMPLIQLGLQPIPIDVEKENLNVSSEKLKEVYKKHKIKMFFLTNLLGFCADIDKIKDFCAENKIILIEDNCESLGTVYKGKKLGNFGVASTFSFYVGHHLSTIEGGAVCTNDEEIMTMLKIVRAHGWDRNLTHLKQNQIRNLYKINSTFYSRYTFYDLGYNFRPTEIAGFMGNAGLPYLDETINIREKNFFTFSILYNNRKYQEVFNINIEKSSNFAFPIICRSIKDRDALIKKCNNKVEIRPIVGGDMTQQPFFKKYVTGFHLQNANYIHNRGLYFANNPDLTSSEIKTIIKIFS